MTETQRKFLTEYLGECWIDHNNPDQLIYARQVYIDKSTLRNRTFTTAQDKQDLLMKVIEKGEWSKFEYYAMLSCPGKFLDYVIWLIPLSPLKTAELICKWKGVE